MSILYDRIGKGYASQRRADPHIYGMIMRALDDSGRVLNVGAGTGSYEPKHLATVAVEPSYEMIRQRKNLNNIVQGQAEALPFDDSGFDSTLAVLTLHHWNSIEQGLEECARATRGRVVILTWDPEAPAFWLTRDYFPEMLELDQKIFPCMQRLRDCLGEVSIQTVPIPADCKDGMLGAYWSRPRAYLDAAVRSGMSSFAKVDDVQERLQQLERDLESGVWQRAWGHLLSRPELDLGYRLVIARLN